MWDVDITMIRRVAKWSCSGFGSPQPIGESSEISHCWAVLPKRISWTCKSNKSSQVLKFTFSPYSGLFGSETIWTYGHINPYRSLKECGFVSLPAEILWPGLWLKSVLNDVPFMSLSRPYQTVLFLYPKTSADRYTIKKPYFLGFHKHLSASGLAVGKLYFWASVSTLLSAEYGSRHWHSQWMRWWYV